MIMTFIIKLYLFLLMALLLISKSLRIMRGSLFIVLKIKHKNLIILNFFRELNKTDLWFLFYEVIFFVTFSVLLFFLVLFIFSSKLETRERVEKTQQILESKDPAQLATLTREDILGDLFYTGGLGYYAQLHTMDSMLSQQGQGIGLDLIGYGSYGYEPKLRQGLLAIPVGIEPGAVSTNVRGHNISQGKDSSNKNSREIADNTSFAMGMNGSVLESAISEQLFCNDTVNPNNKPCYGISTVSGLQRAAAQGQKIYQINSKNKDQLKNIVMSDQTMADDINTAINSG